MPTHRLHVYARFAVLTPLALTGPGARIAAFAASQPAGQDPATPGAIETIARWIDPDLIVNVRGVAIGASLLVLLLVGLADLALRWLVGRKIRRDERERPTMPEHEGEARYWLDLALRAAVPPAALVIWVQGLHLALILLLVRLQDLAWAALAIGALDAMRAIGTLAALVWLLVRVSHVLEARLAGWAARTGSRWDEVLVPLGGKTLRLTLPLVALILGLPMLNLPPAIEGLARQGVSLVLIAAVALILYQLVLAVEALLLAQFRLDVADNLEARRVYTQVTVLRKVAVVVISVFTIASMLMVFESVRQFGTSILASAGIAGIIIGFAAQRSIATLVAGFQIAVTQPIRLDDVVIVENEWGRIEDITLTYVVVRIWDLRRLVVPITYFIEHPFQNWTRVSADILGSVFLYADYRVPIQPLRQELDRILDQSPLWDGQVKVLQVTDAREHTLELRVLASARDAGLAWDLRCEIREKLIDFLQRHYPQCLPRLRAEILERGVTEQDAG